MMIRSCRGSARHAQRNLRECMATREMSGCRDQNYGAKNLSTALAQDCAPS